MAAFSLLIRSVLKTVRFRVPYSTVSLLIIIKTTVVIAQTSILPSFSGPVFGNIQTQSVAFSSLLAADYSKHYQGKLTRVALLLFVPSHWTEMQLVAICGLLNVGEIEARNAKIHIGFFFLVTFSNIFLPLDKSCSLYSKASWSPLGTRRQAHDCQMLALPLVCLLSSIAITRCPLK